MPGEIVDLTGSKSHAADLEPDPFADFDEQTPGVAMVAGPAATASSATQDGAVAGGQGGKPCPPLLCMADVQAEALDFVVPGLIPRGFVTLLDGDAKRGKSLVTLDFSARITNGVEMPGEHDELNAPKPVREPAAVIWYSSEDPAALMTKPRFEAAGGNPRLLFQQENAGAAGAVRQFDEYGVEMFRSHIEWVREKTGHRIDLIVVDPIAAYFPGRSQDVYNDVAVRRVLDPLAEIAAEFRCAVLAVRHNTKSRKGDAQQQGGGSVGFSGAARSMLMCGRHPDDHDLGILAPTACNLVERDVTSMGFRIEGTPVKVVRTHLRTGEQTEALQDAPRIRWIGPVSIGADALVQVEPDDDSRSALDEAVEFLREELGEGERPTKEIQQLARDNGHSLATLKRARKALNVVTFKATGQNGAWMLRIEGAQAAPHTRS